MLRRCRRSLSRVALVVVLLGGWLAPFAPLATAEEPTPKKIVLIAGSKSHGPGDHEYERAARLLAGCLERAELPVPIETVVITGGWPKDPSVLEDAATILMFSDGSDHDVQHHPLLRLERLQQMDRLAKRGVGVVLLHYSLFVPNDMAGQRLLNWVGGYFDYQSGEAANGWYSRITATEAPLSQPAAEHPISRGWQPTTLWEEYYHHMRFLPEDPRRTDILSVDLPGEDATQVVAWCVEREDGGRGFAFTGGHRHANWDVDAVRTMVLNALVWTAGMEVPAAGVQVPATISELSYTQPTPVASDADAEAEPIRTLILTGHNHPAHDWRATTQALVDVLAKDPRFETVVLVDPTALSRSGLSEFDLIVQNFSNWERSGLDEPSRQNLLGAVAGGTGLAMIHFANGAFTDWQEYEQLAPRRWVEGTSGHDPYGPFRVNMAAVEHPITAGLSAYTTTDELYFHQQGDAPVEVLATARSTVTGAEEPLVFTTTHGQGRIFQTLLGHDAPAIRNRGTAELIRRGSAWAAQRELPEVEQTDDSPGRFGASLDPRTGHVVAAAKDAYQQPPLTVDCWTKLDSAAGFNILVANGVKESAAHWELYTTGGTGTLAAYVPGYQPSVIDSPAVVADGQWHHVGLIFAADRLRLVVDGRTVADTPLTRHGGPERVDPLYFGAYPPQSIGCDGLLDEVRIRRGIFELNEVPSAPAVADEHTVGLWHFDAAAAGAYPDASSLNNPALADLSIFEGSSYELTDDRLELIRLDRSARESFLSVRFDSAGRLFAGGREALFVYEPLPDGDYAPAREQFRFPPHSWIMDIELRGDDLYVMTASAIYRLPEARLADDRSQVTAEKIIWGWPVDLHVTLHGMAWGPEGHLYFAAGDPLLNYGDFNQPDHWGHWTVYSQPPGTKTPYTGTGGVFRCRADGTDFQVISRGLRGADGICFDEAWNALVPDNDHESLPARYVPARLLHVTPHAEFFWPRGWMAELTPHRADLLDTVFAGMGRGVPVAISYAHDPALPPELANNLFIPRWGQRLVTRYPLQPRGATLSAEEFPLLVATGQARPVGVVTGPGGRIAMTISYMAQNEGSPTYPSDLLLVRPRQAIAPNSLLEVTQLTTPELYELLTAASFELRRRAHDELLRRQGDALLPAIEGLTTLTAESPLRWHLPWLSAASTDASAPAALAQLLTSPQADIRWAALRALETRSDTPRERFLPALNDEDPRVRLTALAALIERPGAWDQETATQIASTSDRRLRQTAAFLLGRQATVEQLAQLLEHVDSAVRLTALLAVGFQLTVPVATEPLAEGLPLPYEIANAIFELDYTDGRVDLRDLGPVGSFTTAEWWRIAPRTEAQGRLVKLLSDQLTSTDFAHAEQAAYFLSLLGDQALAPQLAEFAERRDQHELAAATAVPVLAAWGIGPFADGLDGARPAHPPQQGHIDLAQSMAGLTWVELTGTEALSAEPLLAGAGRRSAYLYTRVQSGARQPLTLEHDGPPEIELWFNGRRLPRSSGAIVQAEAGGNDLLVRLQESATAPLQLHVRAATPVTIEAPQQLGIAGLADRLRAAATGDTTPVPAELLEVDWAAAAAQGDRQRGKALFGLDGLGCIKCHAIRPDQTSAGGPGLADARARFSVPQLVESILLPSQQVAPAFRATQIVTDSGHVYLGLVTTETSNEIELLLADTTRVRIDKTTIDQRETSTQSPMPTGLIRHKEELQDLLAYLLSGE